MSIEVYPVVHIQDEQQAVEQSALAFDAAADGVFLISHQTGSPEAVADVFEQVATAFPDQYIGINWLQLGTGYGAFEFLKHLKETRAITRYPSGIWVDDAMHERSELVDYREVNPELKLIQYLGGTAFKYTRLFTEEPELAAAYAIDMSSYVDVVTTSGAGTGTPPTPQKIIAMKRAIGDQQLAVASGIDASNIDDYRDSVDKILVASSIETRPYSGIFDKDKLFNFIALAHRDDAKTKP